jgi:UDP-N-acetylmuramoyl-tripeptide--D-alanyl-D-alanine ligase
VIQVGPPRVMTSSVIRATVGLPECYTTDREYIGASCDSRSLQSGELFVALSGQRCEGVEFLPQVANRGAPGAIVRAGQEDLSLPLEYFGVPDPLEALRTLAANVRRDTPAHVVAITGSSGKTTVKEMVACALGETLSVYRTPGNLNSQVGLPLTILRAPANADIWVLEIGASEPGEVKRLTGIAAPDHAIITTVGEAHLDEFGDVEGVLEEKMELARGTSEEGTLVVGDQPGILASAASALRPDAIVAGIEPRSTYQPDEYKVTANEVEFTRDGQNVTLSVGGEHHLRDALITAAIAEALGTPLKVVAHALEQYKPLGMRGSMRSIGGLAVLADCYNANPDSFRAAIAQCRGAFDGRRRVVFAGSMLELGRFEASAHKDILHELLRADFEVIAATGLFAAVECDYSKQVRMLQETDPYAAWEEFAGSLQGDELVLVKGSRGVGLEWVIERLELCFGGEA